MNKELRQVKDDLQKINKYCESRPTPSVRMVEDFVTESGLSDYKDYAQHVIAAIWAAEWIMHTKRVNKSR